MNKFTKINFHTALIIIEALVIIALVIILFAKPPYQKAGTILSSQEVAKKAIDYINEKFMTGKNKASLLSVIEENGVYKMEIKIGNNKYISYVTKNGELLFPEAIDLTPPEPKSFPKTQKPEVDLFVMSFCPFGNQAEEMLIPVVGLLKDKADIELHYIIYSNYATGFPDYCLDKENKFCSMHGVGELNQDVRELCVWKYQKDKFWDFVKEINQNATSKDVDQKWEKIAQDLGIDVEKIKACQENEALDLLAKEKELTIKEYLVQNPAQHQGNESTTISASPTLVINGVIYDGQRSSEEFKKAICSAFKNPPQECKQSLSESSPSTAGGACK
jgi:hypothetical protein